MTSGKGGRVTFLLLLATVLQQGGSQITCKIEVDSKLGLWRDTTPKHQPTNDTLYCNSYSYKETNLTCTSTQCPSASSGDGPCTLYFNADTQLPCLATCKASCNHRFPCYEAGNCSCTQKNARYDRAKMCVPYKNLQNCPSNKFYDKSKCSPTTCIETCPNGQCDKSGTCSCVSGFVRDSKTGKCVPTECANACVGGTCQTYGSCTCPDGSVAGTEEGYKCPPGKADNEARTNNPCASVTCMHGKCDKGKCTCNDGFVVDPKNESNCFPISCPESDPTDYCQRQCKRSSCLDGNGGKCEQGECKCINSFKKDPSDKFKCHKIVCPESDPTDYCQRQCQNNGCTRGGSGWCEQGECKCSEGFKKNPNNSYFCDQIVCPESNHTDYCQRQCQKSGCMDHGQCLNGTCTCNDGYKKLQGASYYCSKIKCPTLAGDDNAYCLSQCTETCSNGNCSERGICKCFEGFVPTNRNMEEGCHHECNDDGSCDLAAILGGIVGVGLAIVIAIIVTAVVMRRMMDRKEQAEREKGQTQDISLKNVFEEPEYVNASQEVEMEENSMYQSLESYQRGR